VARKWRARAASHAMDVVPAGPIDSKASLADEHRAMGMLTGMSASAAAASSSSSVPAVRSYVAGGWRDGGRTVADTNPARPSERVAQVALGDATLAADAVEAAREAFPAWRVMPAPLRGEILRKAGELLDQ